MAQVGTHLFQRALHGGQPFVHAGNAYGGFAGGPHIAVKGGGAGFDQRSLRLSCVRRVLAHFGFTVRAAGDLLDASLSRLPEHVVQKRLAMLGCLLAATRMLDMRLATEADADAWVAEFLERTDR